MAARRRPGRVRRGLALLLLALVGWTLLARYDRSRGPTGAWLQRSGLTPRWARLAGREVRYVHAGRGPRLLLLHGFASSIYTWEALLPALARDYEVAALDLPGFGASELPADLSWRDLSAVATALLDELGWSQVAVLGNSMGGALAVTLAAQQPQRVRALVLIDSAGFNLKPGQRPRLVEWVASPALAGLLEGLPVRRLLVTAGLRQVFYDKNRVGAERVEEYLAPIQRPGWLRATRALLHTRGDEAQGFPELLRAVHQPTLILWGREDRWIPIAQATLFQQALAASRLVVLERCGHTPQEECPDETLQALTAFLPAALGPVAPTLPEALPHAPEGAR
jgi:pimeloyl-ACP methyl ester carboxylesterase